MSENHDYLAAEVLDGVFDASYRDGIGTVTGIADDEEVAEVLVEDQFRREPAVSAAENRNFRSLGLGQRLSLLDGIVMGALAGDEPLIAGFQVGPDLISRSRMRG